MHACFIPFYWSDSVLELASSGHFWSCNNNLPINKVLCISSSGVCLMLKEGCMGLLNFKDIKKNPGSQDYAVFLSSKKISSRKLMSVAFVDMNPFPMRQIQNRRAFHLEKVRLELTELEAIRQTFLRERETSQDRRSFVSDDEEENWPRTCRISRLSG